MSKFYYFTTVLLVFYTILKFSKYDNNYLNFLLALIILLFIYGARKKKFKK